MSKDSQVFCRIFIVFSGVMMVNYSRYNLELTVLMWAVLFFGCFVFTEVISYPF